LLGAILILSLGSRPAWAQGDQLDTDIRLFTEMTAINMAGFDDGLGSPSDSPVRAAVREDLKDFNGSSLELLRNVYQQLKGDDQGENLSQYISFALLCEGPPTFEIQAELPTDLPPDVRPLRLLSPIIAEFYQQAGIERLWAKYQPAYEAEIARYQDPLIQALFEAGGYLRVSPTSRQSQSFKVIFSLLAPPNSIHTRSYRGAVIVVVAPSRDLKVEEIRHAFLMHHLDPLSIRYAAEIDKKEVLSRFAMFAPALEESYKVNFQLLVTKSLVKAVEARLGKSAAADASVQTALREGYILTPYFYEQLAAYQKQGQDMAHYYAELIKAIDLKKEAARLQNVQFAQPEARPLSKPARPRVSEVDRILREAELHLRSDEPGKARQKFTEALEKGGSANAQAHYGLGRVALAEGDPDLARESFTQAAEANTDAQITGMSHIYIARIEDILGNREQAVIHYRLALERGDGSERIRTLAEKGLADPFEGPRQEGPEDDATPEDKPK
jgi:tetratricopeptide (TPR) repeat protein